MFPPVHVSCISTSKEGNCRSKCINESSHYIFSSHACLATLSQVYSIICKPTNQPTQPTHREPYNFDVKYAFKWKWMGYTHLFSFFLSFMIIMLIWHNFLPTLLHDEIMYILYIYVNAYLVVHITTSHAHK